MIGRSTVLLDFGGILYGLDYDRMHRAFDAIGGWSRLVENGFRGISDAFETGALDPDGFRREISHRLGRDVPTEALDSAWNSLLDGILPGAEDFVRGLSTRHRLALVSNTNAIHFAAFGPECRELFAPFDRLFLSHELGARKPEVGFYERVLSSLGARPEDCVFVDDLAVNVEAARRLGIAAVRWSTNQGVAGLADAIEAARSALVPALPPT
ncbi:MAG: HAD family phosphatase [Polyangiales bacterium]